MSHSDIVPAAVPSAKESKSFLNPVTKELIGGSCAGIVQTIVGHPLDVLKTKMQVDSSTNSNAFKVFVDTIKKEKIRGIYRGMTPPLFSAVPNNIIIFAVSKFFRSLICEDMNNPTTLESWKSGFLVGFVLGVPMTPMEVLKCRLAVQSSLPGAKQYNGPIDLAKDLYRKYGFRNGLYQGYIIMTMRELCLSFYFASNTFVKKWCLGEEKRKLKPMETALAGAAAGLAVWTIGFPMDVIKSRIQTSDIDGPNGRRHLGIIGTAKQLYKTDGFKGFTRGIGPCLFRGAFVNAFIFTAYDMTIQYIDSL